MKSRSALFLACLLTLQTTWGADIALRIGNHDIRAEIANTPQSRMSGLMQRDSLCPDCGMLFIFQKSDHHRFWMKNTKLPLSLAFISADGIILDITEMQPNATNIHSTQGAALYGLEMNSGWFAKNGIKPGDRTHGLQHAPQGY